MLPGEKFRIQDNVQKCFWTILGNFYRQYSLIYLVSSVGKCHILNQHCKWSCFDSTLGASTKGIATGPVKVVEFSAIDS